MLSFISNGFSSSVVSTAATDLSLGADVDVRVRKPSRHNRLNCFGLGLFFCCQLKRNLSLYRKMDIFKLANPGIESFISPF